MAHTPFHGQILMQKRYFSPNFTEENTQNLQPRKGGCTFVFSLLVFLFFCLFLPYFPFLFCFYKSQSLKIAHQLRCAAKWYSRARQREPRRKDTPWPWACVTWTAIECQHFPTFIDSVNIWCIVFFPGYCYTCLAIGGGGMSVGSLPRSSLLFGKSKENHPKKQGFLLYAEPLKSLGKKGKIPCNEKNWKCKYLMCCIFSCFEAPRLRPTVTVPGLDL